MTTAPGRSASKLMRAPYQAHLTGGLLTGHTILLCRWRPGARSKATACIYCNKACSSCDLFVVFMYVRCTVLRTLSCARLPVLGIQVLDLLLQRGNDSLSGGIRVSLATSIAFTAGLMVVANHRAMTVRVRDRFVAKCLTMDCVCLFVRRGSKPILEAAA
jgi:hypothetical protein